MYWLSYGGGVNSTALAILLAQGKVVGVIGDWTPIFADTGNEQDATYEYLEQWAKPYFKEIGHPLITVHPKETVLERWQRLQLVGSRMYRACTDHGKAQPIKAYRMAYGNGPQIIGIDAGESHRKKENGNLYPLVDMDIDRDECMEIIKRAGLPIPVKSGCWCCPFSRVGEILALAKDRPDRLDTIETLEKIAALRHGKEIYQFRDFPASYWRDRARDGGTTPVRTFNREWEPPCECYD